MESTNYIIARSRDELNLCLEKGYSFLFILIKHCQNALFHETYMYNYMKSTAMTSLRITTVRLCHFSQ